MLYWIFDLDYTLYQMKNKFSYAELKTDFLLNDMLSRLPCKRIIFTNAILSHTKLCLHHIGITNKFDTIIHRDIIYDLKPNLTAFKKMMLLTGIKLTDKCIFFEDNLSNLIAAKRFGWITVYINRKIINHPSVDYSFSNIYVALQYFLSVIR